MAATTSYRLVNRKGEEIAVSGFAPNLGWHVGDTVTLGQTQQYVIVEIRDGDDLVEATWVVDQLPRRAP